MDGGKEILVEYKKSRDSLLLEKIPDRKHAELLFNFLKLLPIGKKFKATASSGSMEPLILKGDEVEIERVNFSKLVKGDIIAFWSPEFKNIVIHRFYKTEQGRIITKGDDNLVADPSSVNITNFLGKMVQD